MTALAITQVGDKKDRTYRICAQFASTHKVFTVKGIGKDFMLFDGEQHLQSFKTLTKCQEHIIQLAA